MSLNLHFDDSFIDLSIYLLCVMAYRLDTRSVCNH